MGIRKFQSRRTQDIVNPAGTTIYQNAPVLTVGFSDYVDYKVGAFTNSDARLAIQAAIDALYNTVGYGTIFVKNSDDDYTMKTGVDVTGSRTSQVGLQLYPNINIVGESREGVRIKQADELLLHVLLCSSSWVPGGSTVGGMIGLKNFHVNGNCDNQTYLVADAGHYTGCGILVQNDEFLIEDISTEKTGQYGGLRLGGRRGKLDGFWSKNTVDQSSVHGSTAHQSGMIITGGQYYTYDNVLSHLFTNNTAGYGVVVDDGCHDISIHGAKIIDAGYYGFALRDGSDDKPIYNCEFLGIDIRGALIGMSIKNSYLNTIMASISESDQHGVDTDGAYQNTLTLNLFNNGQSANDTYADIYLGSDGSTHSVHNRINYQAIANATNKVKYNIQAADANQKENLISGYGSGAVTADVEATYAVPNNHFDMLKTVDNVPMLQRHIDLAGDDGDFAMIPNDAVDGSVVVKIGDYYQWFDSTGDLRRSATNPTGDTDGVVIGTQS